MITQLDLKRKGVQWPYVCTIDTEYDRTKVPPYNGSDPHVTLGSLEAPFLPALSK